MIDAKQIPDEVVKAAMLANPSLGRDEVLWLLGNALNAWPNWEGSWGEDSKSGELWRTLILPLPKETSE